MKNTVVTAVLVGLSVLTAQAEDLAIPVAKPAIDLTLIPPSPVTDQVTLDIRAAVRNEGTVAVESEIAFFLDAETPAKRLYRTSLDIGPQAATGITFRWPTKGSAGKHRVIVTARVATETFRAERPIEIIASDVRSTRRLGGAWVDIYHHDPVEGKPFDDELGKMTDEQWRELVRAMHAVNQDILVITMMFQNFTHRGQHTIETTGYPGKAYYPSKLYSGRMPIASQDPLETILCEADKFGMHIMPGVGTYAFFDYTPGALRWCKEVAAELWDRYGHHRSFYGWYVSHEKQGSLGNADERREIIEFFREFTPYVHQLAPDKPVMLATNCYGLRGAEDAYRQLLPNLDIICPFAYHRMPPEDLRGEEAAALMQALCDEAGCHLWMDVESFVFRDGGLVPRPIGGLISDFTRFPNFEKTLHYQFPGMMSGPEMTRQPGGPASVKLYQDYARYLREGPPRGLVHAARGKPLMLAAPPDAHYPGAGPNGLVDGQCAADDYRDPQWLGFAGSDLEAVVDLGASREISSLGLRCLQFTIGGIYLPTEVRFAVSEDDRQFTEVATAKPATGPDVPGPEASTLRCDAVAARGRWVRVRAINVGTIPPGRTAAGSKAWLFADEIIVNPQP